MSIWAHRAIETADCYQRHAGERAGDRVADLETVRVMSPQEMGPDSHSPSTLPFAGEAEGDTGPTYDGSL